MPRFEAFIGIVALPRSGTTVVTAVLDVHSRVFGVYEPWNANHDTYDSLAPPIFTDFVTRFARGADPAADTLLVKETATLPRYIDRMADLLRSSDVERREMILILRNPLHAFLSEVQARQDWWGAPELRINGQTFSDWASRTLDALRRMASMALEFNALLLSYERFTGSLRGINALTEAVGLMPEPAQREFERHLDREKVRGDNNVGSSPRPVSNTSVQQRSGEYDVIRPLIEDAPDFPRVKALAELFATLPMLVRAQDARDVIDRMAE